MSNKTEYYVNKCFVFEAIKMNVPFEVETEHCLKNGEVGDYLCRVNDGSQYIIENKIIKQNYIKVALPDQIDESFREEYIRQIQETVDEDDNDGQWSYLK